MFYVAYFTNHFTVERVLLKRLRIKIVADGLLTLLFIKVARDNVVFNKKKGCLNPRAQ